jgi:hypothetical protein
LPVNAGLDELQELWESKMRRDEDEDEDNEEAPSLVSTTKIKRLLTIEYIHPALHHSVTHNGDN